MKGVRLLLPPETDAMQEPCQRWPWGPSREGDPVSGSCTAGVSRARL